MKVLYRDFKVSFLYWRFRIRGSKAISCIVIYTKWFAGRHDHIRTDLSCISDFESSAISQIKILQENTRMELTKMEFKTPTIEDKEEIDRCILADDTRSCDYDNSEYYFMDVLLSSKYAIIDGLFVSHTDEEGGSFLLSTWKRK